MATQEEKENKAQAKESSSLIARWREADPVRRFTWSVISLIVLLLIWYMAADRVAPWTDQARVQAWIVPISPKVSGKVIKVAVTQDQLVKAGDTLALIDPRPYEFARQLFSEAYHAKYFGSAMVGTIILISTSLGATADVETKAYLRILYVFLGGMYAIGMTSIMEPLIRKEVIE